MDTTTLILVILAVIVLVYAFIRGENTALEGLKQSGRMIWSNLVILIASFILAGFIQVLIPKDAIANLLGSESGIKAVLIGSVAGGLIPGPPYAVFPIAGGFYQAGAGLGATVSFITAWSLWSISRLPVEIALINPKVALIRYAITFFVPPAAGLLAQLIENLL